MFFLLRICRLKYPPDNEYSILFMWQTLHWDVGWVVVQHRWDAAQSLGSAVGSPCSAESGRSSWESAGSPSGNSKSVRLVSQYEFDSAGPFHSAYNTWKMNFWTRHTVKSWIGSVKSLYDTRRTGCSFEEIGHLVGPRKCRLFPPSLHSTRRSASQPFAFPPSFDHETTALNCAGPGTGMDMQVISRTYAWTSLYTVCTLTPQI